MRSKVFTHYWVESHGHPSIFPGSWKTCAVSYPIRICSTLILWEKVEHHHHQHPDFRQIHRHPSPSIKVMLGLLFSSFSFYSHLILSDLCSFDGKRTLNEFLFLFFLQKSKEWKKGEGAKIRKDPDGKKKNQTRESWEEETVSVH